MGAQSVKKNRRDADRTPVTETSVSFLGRKIQNVRVIPITTKIVFYFMIFILVSNLTTNYINLMFNRNALNDQLKQLLIKDMKDVYNFANNQYEIFQFNQDLNSVVDSIEKKSSSEFKHKKSVSIGIKPDGTTFFQAADFDRMQTFTDSKSLQFMEKNRAAGVSDGVMTMFLNKENYMAVYKYNPKWDIYIIRGEELNEFYSESRQIFRNVSIIIVFMTILFSLVGVLILRYILRFVGVITNAIINMTKNQTLDLIALENAANDDVTFLGIAFNSLSNTVNNLLTIFRKFVNKDIASKAYREREVRLEGTQKELTILFSDIKSFTYMTETLGTDIIKLLNLHYDQAIREIFRHEGIIGSIIGDALLAVYGALEDAEENKSYQSVLSAYKIQKVAESLRLLMHTRREEVVAHRGGALSPEEEKVYKAVLLEVGVGIDGGTVFYGNIGSHERMTNTVIGDNVNSASRLEGLTRIYKVPVICSEYVKEDIENSVKGHGLRFVEIDLVQVKGKTTGKKVFWPVMKNNLTPDMEDEIQSFEKGLDLYYKGEWTAAHQIFDKLSLPLTDVFKERTKGTKCPKDWNGIWAMTTK